MKPSEQLRAAKRLIEEKGWCQGYPWKATDGQWHDSIPTEERGSFCAWGAFLTVVSDADDETWKFLRLVTRSPITFNDAPTTTKADVLAMYDHAIELAEQQETCT